VRREGGGTEVDRIGRGVTAEVKDVATIAEGGERGVFLGGG
jgi:hypothetical protein